VFSQAKHSRSLVLFLLVGGFTAILYFGLLALFLEVIKLEYGLAVSIAYGLAIAVHFFLNRQVTFRPGNTQVLPQVARYLVVAAINYLLTLVVVYVVVGVLHSNAYVGVAVSIIATIAFGYLGSKLWVFRHRDQANG
jgi:putative flippase GtrA